LIFLIFAWRRLVFAWFAWHLRSFPLVLLTFAWHLLGFEAN
jgi:hypothetical protein